MMSWQLRQHTDISLKFAELSVPSSPEPIVDDISTDSPRPYLPPAFRRIAFHVLHTQSHPGIRATQHLISTRYVWSGIRRDVAHWVRTCLQCQRSKVHRHTISPLGTFLPPDSRFNQVHLDLVGPLPDDSGFRYLLMCIDHFTRWCEAIPLSGCTTAEVARTLLAQWVSRLGVPATVTTDRGAQFEYSLLSELLSLLGTARIRTTSHHPCANGIVERFHRHLKSALRATDHAHSWVDALPSHPAEYSYHVQAGSCLSCS